MKKLIPASVSPQERAKTVEMMVDAWKAGVVGVRAAIPQARTEQEAREAIRRTVADEAAVELYLNDVYQVALRRRSENVVHLSIKRIDREPIHDWRDLQEIKNQLLGQDCEAVELYPAEDRRVDAANQFHLWGSSDPTFRFPFGFQTRAVDDASVANSKNRKL